MQQESRVCSLEALIEELNFFHTVFHPLTLYAAIRSRSSKTFFNNPSTVINIIFFTFFRVQILNNNL